MTDAWENFLTDQDLCKGVDGHSHTSNENVDAFQKLAGDTLCDLRHTALVRVRGRDSESFLQNQLTNDMGSVGADTTALTGYCNAKGRLVCLFRVWRDDEDFVLQMPVNLVENCLERLRKYVLRAKVEFLVDPDLAAFGVSGKTAAKGLEQLVGPLPGRERPLLRSGKLAVVRIAGNSRPRFQVAGPTEACINAWGRLKRHAAVAGSWSWARLDIMSGIPTIVASTSESFIPQMVNLDLLGGVNFQKGCYPGQEIVARMHYLGNLKQRMARFRVDDEPRPLPGDRIYAQNKQAAAGTVVDAQPGTGSDWELLGVVRIADLEQPSLHLKNQTGPQLFRQDLPYSLTAA